jgi:secreted trypsin-like serine protease
MKCSDGSIQNGDAFSITLRCTDLNNCPSNAVYRKSTRIFVNPHFVLDTLTHDVAILLLDEEVTSVDPVPLISYDNREIICPGQELLTIGHGVSYSREERIFEQRGLTAQLMGVSIPVRSNSACQKMYDNLWDETMLCVGDTNLDACQGDSGGPLFFEDSRGRAIQVGTVSWGIGCGDSKHWGVYSNLLTSAIGLRSVMAGGDLIVGDGFTLPSCQEKKDVSNNMTLPTSGFS